MSERDANSVDAPEDGAESKSSPAECAGAASKNNEEQLIGLSAKPTARRGMLLKLGIAMNVVAAALIGVPIIGYVASAARRRAYQKWVVLGDVDSYPERTTRIAQYVNPFTVPWDGKTATMPCWVRRISGNKFQVFAINCTHLGCPVSWFDEPGLFLCPCHGSVFYADGGYAAGPAPRGLYEMKYKIEGDQLVALVGHYPTLQEPGSANVEATQT